MKMRQMAERKCAKWTISFYKFLINSNLFNYAFLGGEVFHYRDKNGLECDTVIHLRSGKYGLAEVKIGGDKNIDEAAGNLKKLASIIDTNKQNAPQFLMVLTGVGQYAYTRTDGIHVVPIGCLKP